ncbi:MAG: hypothetical protein MI757_04390, partial [Pirellulales bacterium]|nr:hypothetical protein [Pirellulales bacterium]
FLKAEMLLESLTRRDAGEVAGSATLQLAELYRSRQRIGAAASKYRDLSNRYGTVVLRNGRAGGQHIDELGADDPVRKRLNGHQRWPAGLPKTVTTENEQPLDGDSNTIPMRPSLVIQGPRSPAIDGCTLHFYYNDRAIAAHDRFGRLLWKATVDSGVEVAMSYVPSIPLSYAQIRGHLVLASLGNSLLAIDCLNVDENRQARVLWHKDLSDAMLPASSTTLLNRRWMRMRLGARWGGGALAFGRLAAVDVAVTKDAVFYTHHRSLHAVDLLTGSLLWKRGNVPTDSVLLADQDRVVAIPPDARPALVVRAADGVAEGYCRVPAESNRLATVGTSMLTWTVENDSIRVALIDPWKKTTSWTRSFVTGSVASLVDDQWVSVMQPDGQWKLLRCDDGSVVFGRRLDAMPELNLLHVFRDDHRTYIAASAPLPPDSPLLIQVTMGGRKNPFVNGKVYAVDNKTGELVWSTPVEGHGLLLDQPHDLPVIAFASSVYDRDEARRYSRVMCLDRPSGKLVCDERGSSSAFSRIELVGDPDKSTVRIRSATRTIDMTWKK